MRRHVFSHYTQLTLKHHSWRTSRYKLTTNSRHDTTQGSLQRKRRKNRIATERRRWRWMDGEREREMIDEIAQGTFLFLLSFLVSFLLKMVDGKREGRQVSQQVRVQCRVNSTNDLCAQRCPAHFASTTIGRLLLPPWPRGADSRPGMDFQTVAVGGLWPSCEGACRAFARRIYSAARLDNRASDARLLPRPDSSSPRFGRNFLSFFRDLFLVIRIVFWCIYRLVLHGNGNSFWRLNIERCEMCC